MPAAGSRRSGFAPRRTARTRARAGARAAPGRTRRACRRCRGSRAGAAPPRPACSRICPSRTISSASSDGSSDPSASAFELGELAVAAGLGGLVAKERAPQQSFTGCGQLVHAVLDVRAADAGRGLGSQRERPPTLVLEGEHLLLDDVGGLPHPAREHRGVLEDRRLEGLVAGSVEHLVRCARAVARAAARPRAARRRCPAGPGACRPPANGPAQPGTGCSRARRRAW